MWRWHHSLNCSVPAVSSLSHQSAMPPQAVSSTELRDALSMWGPASHLKYDLLAIHLCVLTIRIFNRRVVGFYPNILDKLCCACS